MNLLRCHWRMLMLLKLAHHNSHVKSVSAFCEWQVQHQVRLFCYFHTPFCVWSGIGRYGHCSSVSEPYLSPISRARSEHCLCVDHAEGWGSYWQFSFLFSEISLFRSFPIPGNLLLWFLEEDSWDLCL